MSETRRPPGQPRKPGDFEPFYAGTPPWDIGRPQPAFLRLADSGAIRGRVLDVGCGTGEHALMAAARGLEVVGVDTAVTAIAAAERKAGERGLTARFQVADVLHLAALGESFDTALDSGLFHILGDEDRVAFVASLSAVVRPGGRYFMLCFNEHVPGNFGPRRVTQAEIRTSFARGWQVDSIEPDTLDNTGGDAIPAWLAALTRL